MEARASWMDDRGTQGARGGSDRRSSKKPTRIAVSQSQSGAAQCPSLTAHIRRADLIRLELSQAEAAQAVGVHGPR